jgi:phosphatidylglycerol:prolipoprotein diacylglycerol transferase
VLPVLFSVGGVTIHTYGVLTAAGFCLGICGAVVLGRRDGIPADFLWDLALVILVSAIGGSRLEYVRTRWSTYSGHPLAMLDLRDGGLVFYGGLIGALVASAAFLTWRRQPAWKVLDLYAPFVPLGHALGRLGCFAAGCCYGRPTDLPWGVVFPPGSQAPAGVPLHPTQLYEAGFDTLLGIALLVLRARSRAPGLTFAALLIFYPAFRAFNESFRGDSIRGYVGFGISNGQAISLGLFVVGVIIARARWRTAR